MCVKVFISPEMIVGEDTGRVNLDREARAPFKRHPYEKITLALGSPL